ncbi:MAG TPA: MXAN_6230/SCO0854 family RING domain-containing protein [Acidimicrobiales bacterium]|nr:MXAN_6230/SCO0854 family RING domain-containing protein [Acidimicrobiales bacterium]
MDALATALLRRTGRVFLPEPPPPPADGGRWVRALEADLAERGWLLDAGARGRLAALDPTERTRWGDWLLAAADQAVGAHRVHLPLFRSFPGTPADPDRLFVERLLAHWFQDSDVRCVLCGGEGTVGAVDPCGHLVCSRCFDPAAYGACPVCGRRAAGTGLIDAPARPPGPPLRLTVVSLGDDPTAEARRVRDELVARTGALGQQDRDDLAVLIEATSPLDLGWLPDVVPSRETAALVGAWALRRAVLPDDVAALVPQVASRWTTTTDVARTLWAHAGGDPGLVLPRRVGGPATWRPPTEPRLVVPVPRVRALPRALRTAALARLHHVGAAAAAEDMGRHPTVWKRLAERLHPFERVGAHPEAAVAFAALRGTQAPATSALGAAMAATAARYPGRLVLARHRGDRVSVRSRSFAAAVQDALDGGDLPGALSLLGTRPGEFWRRADHLARLVGDDPALHRSLLDAAAGTAAGVAPGVLASAGAELRDRASTVAAPAEMASPVAAEVAARRSGGGAAADVADRPPRPPAPAPGTPRRVFFPRGSAVRSWTAPERRPPLPAALVDGLGATVDAELVRRAARLPAFDLSVLDAGLLDVPAPTRARASSAQLAGWTRGTRLSVPDLEVLRLFLHWLDAPGGRVDLDLSCAFYAEDWSHAGHCDYTTLRFAGGAAVHSGDLTSAPAPFGATEYLDLSPAGLGAAGVRYAVPVVFSYNDVPFELLPDAFAGFSLPTAPDAQFDPGRVLQRFDLRGDVRMLVPFVLDVSAGVLLWVDVQVTSRGYGHRAGRHSANLARLGADLWDHFTAGGRPTAFDLGAWHAMGRGGAVHVADLGAQRAERVAGDSPAALREAAGRPAQGPLPDIAGRTVLAVVADADGLAPALGDRCADGSLAVALVGRASAPWHTVRPDELLAGLA